MWRAGSDSGLFRVVYLPLNIYVGTLSGLQRLDMVNLLRVISVTTAQLGGIVILLLWHDLYVFLMWLAGSRCST